MSKLLSKIEVINRKRIKRVLWKCVQSCIKTMLKVILADIKKNHMSNNENHLTLVIKKTKHGVLLNKFVCENLFLRLFNTTS